MKRLNIKLAVILLTVFLVLGVSVHFLHGYQVARHAGGLLDQAQEAREDRKLTEAIQLYDRYLKHDDNPESAQRKDAMEQMALLYLEVAEQPGAGRRKKGAAFQAMEAVVREYPDLTDLRRKLFEFTVTVGALSDAIKHAELLEKAGHHDAELDLKLAAVYNATGKFAKASQVVKELVGYDDATKEFGPKAKAPKKVDAYVLLAKLLRDQEHDTERADAAIEKMVEVNGKDYLAHLARYRYWKVHNDEAKADQSLDRASELNPHAAEVLLPLAERALAKQEIDKALELLRDGLKLYPKDEMIIRGLAIVEVRKGDSAGAKKVLRDGLDQLPESQTLLALLFDLQHQDKDAAGARKTLALMKEADFSPPLLDLCEGKILFNERKWLEAVDKLQQARERLADSPVHCTQIDMLVGKSYEAMGQPDRALDVFRRVSSSNNATLEARLSAAASLASSGKYSEAQKEYEQLAQQLGPVQTMQIPQLWSPLLRFRMAEQMRLPREQQDWSKVDAMVAALQNSKGVTETGKAVFEAEVLVRKGQIDQARAVLVVARDKAPTDVAAWTALLNFEAQLNGEQGLKQAAELLETAPEGVREGLPMRILQASLIGRLGGEEAKAKLAALEKRLEKLKPDEQYSFLQAVANEYLRRNERDDATRVLRSLADANAKDIQSRAALFEIARDAGDIDSMRRISQELGKTLGAESSQVKIAEAAWRISATRNSQRKKSPQPTEKLQLDATEKGWIAEARKLLVQLTKERPEWQEPHKLLVEVCAFENDTNGMIAGLQAALKLGPLDAAKMRQLAEMLAASGRDDEARGVFDQLGGSAGGSEWTQLGIAIRNKDNERAEGLLARLKPAEDAPAAEHLRYGRALRQLNKLTEAEAALRIATQTDPNLADGWLLLVNTLVSAQKMDEAKLAADEIGVRMSTDKKDFVLGQAYEIMRDLEKAEAAYARVVAAEPKSLAANQMLAAYFMRNNLFEKAPPLLDRLLKEGPTSTEANAKETVEWARRAQAVILAAEGSWTRFLEAEKILSAKTDVAEVSTADLMLHIGLLANRKEPSCMRRAITMLEELQTRQPLQTAEQVNLARLYERAGQWTKANEMMLNVLTQKNVPAMYYLWYTDMLLRNGGVAEVPGWLDRYDQLQPGDSATNKVRATVLVKQGRSKEGVDMLLRGLGKRPVPAEKVGDLRETAMLLEVLEQYDEAEKLYREYVNYDPQGRLWLARFLGFYRGLDEALAVLEGAGADVPPLAKLAMGLQVLRAREDRQPKHFDQLGKWYKSAIEADPDSVQVKSMAAEVFELKGSLDKCEQQYRQLLARKELVPEQKAMLWNNLAFILAFQNKNTDEAIRMVNDAMKILGPTSDLLDTRGTVYLAMGDAEKARADFADAVLAPTAMKYVHLAFAERSLNNLPAAKGALEKAQEFKLKRHEMHEAERAKYKKLAEELGVAG